MSSGELIDGENTPVDMNRPTDWLRHSLDTSYTVRRVTVTRRTIASLRLGDSHLWLR
jgi:hypothetical protein